MRDIIIAGTVAFLPKRQLKNSELAETLDTSNDSIVSCTGIESRYIAASHETTAYMASKLLKSFGGEMAWSAAIVRY